MSEDGTEQETADRTMQRRARRAILTLAAVLVAYYAAPVGEIPSKAAVALSVLGLIAGLGLARARRPCARCGAWPAPDRTTRACASRA